MGDTDTVKVPIARTCLTDHDIEAVLSPLRSGWLVQGPIVQEFEKQWSEYTGAKHSIAVTSCTSGLYLSLLAMGICEGDEVIVPAFSWVATANVVEMVGATVVFCDVDIRTFNIDVEQLEGLISPKTRAIIPVHLFGLCADIENILSISRKYDLRVIEDSACGLGSFYKNCHSGTFGDTGVFSFHPRKSITTGEGGMVTTDSDEIAEKIRQYRDHGAKISDLQRHLGPKPFLLADHVVAGGNFRMTDIQAALGVSQMRRVRPIIEERQHLAAEYSRSLDCEWLEQPFQHNNFVHSFQSYPCLLIHGGLQLERAEQIRELRNGLMENLQLAGISTRPATHAIHLLTFYKSKYQLVPESYPNAYLADSCSISLPLFNGLTNIEQAHVISTLNGISL